MAPTIEEWWTSLPVITKGLLLACSGTTMAAAAGIVGPADLFFSLDAVLTRWQIWRLITCFTFLGPIGIGLIVQLYMISKYGTILESTYFSGSTGRADFVFMLLVGGAVLVLVSLVVPGLYFLGASLVTYIIYVWSRKDPFGQATFFGFRFSIWQLPFVLMVFHVLMGGSVIPDLAGIFAGHVYHFSIDIVPKVYGLTVLKTPSFLASICGEASFSTGYGWRSSGPGYRLN